MSSDNYFDELTKAFRQLGLAFNSVQGSQLIPSFCSTSEEEFIPDPESRDENERYSKNLKDTWVKTAETETNVIFKRNFCSAPIESTLQYFIDGSVRSVRALDGVEGNFVYPIVIGQIGAASLTRNQLMQPAKQYLDTDIVLLFPLSKLSDTLRNNLNQKLKNTPLYNKLYDPLVWQDAQGKEHHDDERDYSILRSRASRRAKDLMAKIERKVMEQCVKTISNNSEYIAVDGSLFSLLKEAKIPRDKLYQAIGISKSFSMTPLILIEEALNRHDCIRQLMTLEEGERTDAIELHIDPYWVVTWYQRIRPRKKVNSPLEGIIKVEVHCDNYPASAKNNKVKLSKSSENWSQKWDKIANLVYSERLPIPFHEERWHVLLYPTYCCEQLLKSSFLSIEVLRGLCTQIVSNLGV